MAGVTKGLEIIDWPGAMVQVGDDVDFLNEVLEDLLSESAAAEAEIGSAIAANDFNGVMKAAHRIKGSASYLCCHALKEVSLHLQNAGHDGMNKDADPAALMNKIIELFDEFKTCLSDLRREIANHNG